MGVSRHIPELLAPAGGPAEFNAALAAGADAIYCGFGNTFNARRGAQSFDSQTFGEACRRAHVVGARVYVTVNVVIRDDELPTVLALIRRAWLLGADAFIIQDWGLLCEVKRRWPQVECHVSTQANVHDDRGMAWCQELGAERVTLSRELSLTEIALLARVGADGGVEVECFCHGAICFCYSGVCMLSSSFGSRSANRGMCAQPCRLPYELVDENGSVLSSPDRGRPLCPKDFYSFEDLRELADGGVASLKIEGRLKGADYVYAVVAAYREELDDLREGYTASRDAADERRTRLKRAFNRDFTNAYLHGTSGDELMSYERSNNRGELVGMVVASRSFGSVKVRRGGGGGGRERLRTATIAEADVRLDKPVGKGDLLELRPVADPSQFLTANAPSDAAAGEVLTCRTPREVVEGALVRVIRSQQAMEDGARAAEAAVPRRRKVRVRVVAQVGKSFTVELETADGRARAAARGFTVEPARTRPVSEADLVAHVGRMGGSWFEPVSFDVRLDEGCGMGFSAVHRVRTQACEALERALLEPYERRTLSPGPAREDLLATLFAADVQRPAARDQATPVEVCSFVSDAESACAVLAVGAQRVYAPADALQSGEWPKGVITILDEVCRETDHARLDPLVTLGASIAVGNVSELALAQKRGSFAEVRECVPVHNLATMRMFEDAGTTGFWLSPELSLAEVEVLAPAASVPVGMMVFGRIRTMTSEHCVLQVADACVHDCARCALRRQRLFLRGVNGELLPVATDLQGRSRIYAARPLDLTPQVGALVKAGISRLAVDATLLSPSEAAAAVERVVAAMQAVGVGRRPAPRLRGASAGHLFEPIQ